MSDYFNLKDQSSINSSSSNFKPQKFNLNKISKSKIFKLLPLLLIILAVPITIILSKQNQDNRNYAAEKKNQEETLPPKGYIVEFKSPPASRFTRSAGMTTDAARSSFNSKKANVLAEHKTAKNDVLAKVGKGSFDGKKEKQGDKKVVLLSEFTNAFNGIAVDADSSQIEEIKKSAYVKAVHPNNSVQATLMDSVPLIGADQVWQSVKDKYDGSPVTGKGVNVAVIDTGVDTTHRDLGSSIIDERKMEKITTNPIYGFYHFDSGISLENNKLAYPSNRDEISIYSFSDKTTQQIKLNTPNDLPDPLIYNTYLRGDDLFFIALSVKGVGLFKKNITTGELTKISNLGQMDFHGTDYDGHSATVIYKFSFANGKIYYERQTGQLDSTNHPYFSFYSYNLSTGQEEKILNDTLYPTFAKISGNKLIYAVQHSNPVTPYTDIYDRLVLRNLDTGEEKVINSFNVGPVIDFKNNLILTAPVWYGDIYFHLYNIETNEVETISYVPSYGQGNVTPNYYEYTILGGFEREEAFIGDGIVFFEWQFRKDQYVAYNLRTKLYNVINLKNYGGSLTVENKKACFIGRIDLQIYCHDYDESYNYPLPTSIYNSKVKDGQNFVDSRLNALDDNGHGTHVAGIIGGSGALKGVAPDANIYAYKVLNFGGSGFFSDIINALDKAIQTRYDSDPNNDIQVINLSLGATCTTYTQDCGPDDPQSIAVDNASSNGIVVVVAAGNSGPSASTVGSPGVARSAITVGAVNKSRGIADFSSRGPVIWNGQDYNKPDILAPGVNICSAELFGAVYPEYRCLDSNHISLSGTSMSTPHIAGVTALILQLHPDWTPAQVKDAIINNADDLGLDRNAQGAGVINARKIFNITLSSTPTKIPTNAPTPTFTPTPTPTPTVTKAPTSTPIPLKLTLNPSADAFVRSTAPNQNFGKNTNLRVDSSPSEITYLKFNLTSLAGKTIKSAKLVLKVSDATSKTLTLRRATIASWTESGITFNNKPAFEATITTFNATTLNQVKEITATNVVNLRKGGNLTLGITSGGDEVGAFYSRESTNKPQLIIEYQ